MNRLVAVEEFAHQHLHWGNSPGLVGTGQDDLPLPHKDTDGCDGAPSLLFRLERPGDRWRQHSDPRRRSSAGRDVRGIPLCSVYANFGGIEKPGLVRRGRVDCSFKSAGTPFKMTTDIMR